MAAFMATIPELSGQARRVAKRFAIAAAALELAAPVTGLPVGVGMAGVKNALMNGWKPTEQENTKTAESLSRQRILSPSTH